MTVCWFGSRETTRPDRICPPIAQAAPRLELRLATQRHRAPPRLASSSAHLEGISPMSVDLRATTFIRASKEAVWTALTDPETIEAFHPAGMRVAPLPGGGHELRNPIDGASFIREPLVACFEEERLELGFQPAWIADDDGKSRVIFALSEEAHATRVELTQTHCATFGIGENWDRFLASMKSYLETGSGLHIPPGARD